MTFFSRSPEDCSDKDHRFSIDVVFDPTTSRCKCGLAQYRYDEKNNRGIIKEELPADSSGFTFMSITAATVHKDEWLS